MAELFLARTLGPEGFEKLVVLKKILPTHSDNPRFVRLFLDEAKLAATLDHPHIAHVYDMGKVEGHYFFAMEYVHGQDVRTTLRRTARLNKKFPVDHAVQIARNVAAALHYAHERRRADGALLDIVHRDVSPSNVLVSYDGAVKLVDFGVAKAATSTVKTRTGTLKGKISYMSPEQARGSPIDRRSDIFSLGIVLWEMVTTQRLFKSDNDLATIQMIINSRPQPPSQVRPECSPELDRIVLRALSNEVEERYQTAEQLQLDLEELAREQKLKQSSVALRTWMHELFAEEIRAWSLAQASGQTLTEHLERAEMTTPVSESELDLEYYEDPDDYLQSEQVPTMLGTPPPGTQQVAVAPPPALHEGPTTVLVGDVLTRNPTPVPGLPTVDLRAPTHSPFPVAPREWRPSVEEPAHIVDANELRNKRVIIGASIAFGTLVLIAIALGGNNVPAKVEAPPAAPAPTRVEMKSEPAVAPAPQPAPEPATPPAEVVVEEKPETAPPREEEPKQPKRKPKSKPKSEAKSDKPKVEEKPAPPPPRKWDPNGVEEPQ